MIPGDDPVELRPVRRPASAELAQGGEVELGCTWSAWDLIRYLAPWAALGLLIGAVLVAVIFANT